MNTNGESNGTPAHRKKSLILNAFVEMCEPTSYDMSITEQLTRVIGSGHQSPGLWRHPQDKSADFNNIEHWVDLAKLLEEAKIHGIFIADVLGVFRSAGFTILIMLIRV